MHESNIHSDSDQMNMRMSEVYSLVAQTSGLDDSTGANEQN